MEQTRDGPYEIVKKINEIVYHIKISGAKQKVVYVNHPKVVYMNHLVLYHGDMDVGD